MFFSDIHSHKHEDKEEFKQVFITSFYILCAFNTILSKNSYFMPIYLLFHIVLILCCIPSTKDAEFTMKMLSSSLAFSFSLTSCLSLLDPESKEDLGHAHNRNQVTQEGTCPQSSQIGCQVPLFHLHSCPLLPAECMFHQLFNTS